MSAGLLAPLFLMATLGLYAFARWLHGRIPMFLFSPIVLTPLVLFIVMEATHTPFAVYFQDTHWLVWLLGPATIAFAYPIYSQRALVRRYPLTLGVGVIAGLVLGLSSSWLVIHLFSLPPDLARSILPRFVSTPFALSAANALGGTPNITVICVMVTGIFGVVIGEVFLGWLGVRSRIARGAAYGAAAHALGTSKAYEIGIEEGTIASLTMVFVGIAMMLLAPFLAAWMA